MASVEELESMRIHVEIACQNLREGRVDLAEKVLFQFRSIPKVSNVAFFILETPSSSSDACFHAVGAIIFHLESKWSFISNEEKSHILNSSLQLLLGRRFDAHIVTRRLLSLITLALQLNWLDMSTSTRRDFIQYIVTVCRGELPEKCPVEAISLLENIVTEFTNYVPKVWLPKDHFEEIKRTFQLQFYEIFFQVAGDILGVSSNAFLLSGEKKPSLLSSLKLFLSLLSSFSSNLGHISPPSTLELFLRNPSNVTWIFQLYQKAASEGRSQEWEEEEFGTIIRQIVIQLCSLSSFLKDDLAVQTLFLQQLTPQIMFWIPSPTQAVDSVVSGGASSALNDSCTALATLAKNVQVEVFDEAFRNAQLPGGGTELLSILTNLCIRKGGSTAEDSPLSLSLASLLQAWMALLQVETSATLGERKDMKLLPDNLVHGANLVSQQYLQVQLAASSASAMDEASNGGDGLVPQIENDEFLESMAILFRASASLSLFQVGETLQLKKQILIQCLGSAEDVPLQILEEIVFLITLSGYILADSGEGEIPEIPELFLRLSPGGPRTGPSQAILLLSSCFLDLASLCIREGGNSIFTPRVMEALVWFLARWCDTYLIPLNKIEGLEIFGRREDGGQAEEILHTLLGVAFFAVTSWPGESDLQELVASNLMNAFIKKSKLRETIVTMEEWQRFEKAFSEGEATLLALPGFIQGSLAQALSNAAPSEERIKALMQLCYSECVRLSQDGSTIKMASRPDVMLKVQIIVERLRGCIRGCRAVNYSVAMEVGLNLQDPLLTLLKAYILHPTMVYLILKFWVEWTTATSVYFSSTQCRQFMAYCASLVELYAHTHAGKVSVQPSESLTKEAELEKYKDLYVVLELFSCITTSDMVDFEDGGQAATDMGKMITTGLSTIIPLLSSQLLLYPKLYTKYFELAENLFSQPECLVKLTNSVFSLLTNSVQWGLQHQDQSVVHFCLSSIHSVAFWQWRTSRAGSHGFSDQSFIVGFLHQIFQLFIQRELHYGTTVFNTIMDVMVPLLLCEWVTFKNLVVNISEKLSDESKSILEVELPKVERELAAIQSGSGNLKEFKSSLQSYLKILYQLTRNNPNGF